MDQEGRNFEGDLGQTFMRLYVLYQHRIYRFIVTLVPNYSDADDILQNTVSVMWRKFADFQEGTNFLSWAFSIARYEVFQYRRQKQKVACPFSEMAIKNIEKNILSSTNNQIEKLDNLHKCLKKLKEEDRELLKLRYRTGSTIKRIAQHLNRNVHTLYKEFKRIHLTLLHCVRLSLDMESKS